METGFDLKDKKISIKKFGKDNYEIEFEGGRHYLWLDEEDMIELRDKINEVLLGEDRNSEILREAEDYTNEISGESEPK